jgi:hypothetical protein
MFSLNLPVKSFGQSDIRLASGALPVRLQQLETQIIRWTNRLMLEQGALSKPVPETNRLSVSTSAAGLIPIYTVLTGPDLSRASPSSDLVRGLLPENSVVIQVQGVPSTPNLSFSQEQSDAIATSLTPKLVQRFNSLKDDRRKVIARTLMFAALVELRRGAISPSEFKFVSEKIYDVSSKCVLPKFAAVQETPIPGATSARKPAEQAALSEALKTFQRQPKAKFLSDDQQEVLARIIYRSWEIQTRSRQTTSSFPVFLNNATRTQWTDWVDSAKDQGIPLSLLQGWQSQLRRKAGEQSTVVIDILLALPNQSEKQALASQYFVNGMSLEQSIARARAGKPVEISVVEAASFRILVQAEVQYQRNPKSLGPKKLHANFSIAAANQLDQLFPGIDWRIDQNPKTKNFVIRSGPSTGKQVLGTVQLPHGIHNVWTITPTNRNYAATSALNRLSQSTVNELNNRFGLGQWSCRPKGDNVIKILSKVGNRPMLAEVKIEPSGVQVISSPPNSRTRVSSKSDLNETTVSYINRQVGRDDWLVLATKQPGVFEIVDPASKIVFGKLDAHNLAKNFGFKPLERHARPPKDYLPTVGAHFVKQCDEAFGAGTWRLEKASENRYQIHRAANYRIPGESYFLGSMSTTNGGVTWTLNKSPGAKKY